VETKEGRIRQHERNPALSMKRKCLTAGERKLGNRE
jgi:hypothetical protein